MKAFIIHGTFGSPSENWFPWLKAELEKLGFDAFVPRFPTPEGQSLDNWMKAFEQHKGQVDGETVFVGHSLGPAFILSLLEQSNRPVKACFLVSGFTGSLGNPKFDEINKTFTEKEFNWDKIKRNCGQFFVFHSDNDPHVSMQKARDLAGKLGVKPIIVKGAGHFNEAAGYKEFPLLLEKIREAIE